MEAPDDATFERILREKYQPLCTPDEYARLRRACGLGDLIDGEAAPSKTAGTPKDAGR